MKTFALCVFTLVWPALTAALEPVPDGLVVLNFDDSNKSDITIVAPVLERYGFGATFYVTRGLGADRDHEHFLTWEEVKQLHERGFEIGNHTKTHPNLSGLSKPQIRTELRFINEACTDRGIDRPVTFCYPGFQHAPHAVEVLREEKFLFARRGVGPEFRDDGRGARGPAYDPRVDHPLLIPTTGYSGPDWDMGDLVWAVDQARDGKIAVLCFHGIPGPLHPWVHTPPALFEKYMGYLKKRGCTVIAMRDLAKYVDPKRAPDDAYAPIRARVAERAKAPKRVLLLGQKPDGHPPGTHEYLPGMRIIAKMLEDMPGIDVTTVSADEPWEKGPQLIDRADTAVIFLSEGAKWLSADAARLAAMRRLASRGGGLVGLHWGIGTRDAKNIPAFVSLLGACHGGPDRRYKVVETTLEVTKHPITSGLRDFALREELYYRLKTAKPSGSVRPILSAKIEGTKETVSWAWTRPDGGRSFGYSGLHFHENWKRPEYRRLVAQGILWTLDRPIPAKGIETTVSPASPKSP